MAFDDKQLAEIRDRLKVSDVVGSTFPLIKKGGGEFVAKGNESFTVNDKKQIWTEFGSGGDGKGHDVFDFMQTYCGLTFVGAVEELARQAGISLNQIPGGAGPHRSRDNVQQSQHRSAPARNGHDPAPQHDADSVDSRSSGTGEGRDRDVSRSQQQGGKKEVVDAWDYRDLENNLLYQTVRMQERMPDGSWRQRNGKTWKTFMHRRPSPDGDETWILGLDVVDRDTGAPLEFIRTPKSQAWLRATEERLQWSNIEKRTFEGIGNVEHWLYNANDVVDELQEPREDQRTIFMPEGEGKVDVLKEWGLLAVTNSAGAKHFTEACAAFFSNARNVVILADNDRAGAERVAKVGPMLKAVGVELIQALNFRDVWPKCPVKGDIKDWRDQGGTKDQLLEIIDQLPAWQPEPYKSKFGAKTSLDLTAKASAYPWRIKGIIPMFDDVLIMGPSRSGKTFEALDMLMHCHFGNPFAGKKVEQCGGIYLTYEGATGFENRLRAYLLHHGIKPEDLHSFAWITRPPGLYASEDNVVSLAEEINELAKGFKLKLGIIGVDTHNSATRGSSEIKSEDIDKILSRYLMLKEKTDSSLWIIGHTNAEGRHRGNEQFFNGIETSLLVQRVQEHRTAKQVVDLRDDDGRVRRKVTTAKQREGSDELSWEFVLQPVKIGTDDDGEDITSMVSIEPASKMPENAEQLSGNGEKPQGVWLNQTMVAQFQSLLRAIEDVGEPPAPELQLPKSISRVVMTTQLGSEWRKKVPRAGDDEPYAKYMNRTKASLRRFLEECSNKGVIGLDKVDHSTPENKTFIHYVWPTGKRVFGRGLQWPSLPKTKASPKPILAPGETEQDAVF